MNLLVKVSLAACLLAACAVLAEKRSYSGYSVYRVNVKNDDDAEVLHQLEQTGIFDFWTDVKRQGPVDIMASPAQLRQLGRHLRAHDLDFSVMIEDVQALVDATEVAPRGQGAARQGHSMDWEAYHEIDDIYSYWDYIEATFDYASTESLGQSYEGTEMRLMKICVGGCGNKPAMYIDGGIHAREWISPATVTYFVKKLTEDAAGDEDFLTKLDWYILPSVNPDGYAYTFSDERFWRKTRSPNDGSVCIGTDANRNYGFHWDEGGASDGACIDTYHGDQAFSEVETRNVRDFIDANKDTIKFFNSVHSYSQYVLLPWGYTEDPCPNYDEMEALANKGAAALEELYGTKYTVGCIPCILYVASGGACDYALGTDSIKYAYSMELRDQGRYGFLLPADQIIPTGEETWAFHLSAAEDVIAEFA